MIKYWYMINISSKSMFCVSDELEIKVLILKLKITDFNDMIQCTGYMYSPSISTCRWRHYKCYKDFYVGRLFNLKMLA